MSCGSVDVNDGCCEDVTCVVSVLVVLGFAVVFVLVLITSDVAGGVVVVTLEQCTSSKEHKKYSYNSSRNILSVNYIYTVPYNKQDIALCSWARHFTLTVPLSTQEYKWVPANCWGNLTNCWGVTCHELASQPGGVEILLAASCYGNWDKLRPDEPVGSKASLYNKLELSFKLI